MDNTISVTVNDEIVHVLNYLPFEDKTQIIELAYQEATDVDGLCNYRKMSVLKYIYMIMYYTDIQFTDEEKVEPFKLYDKMMQDGSFDLIINSIPESEVNFISEYAWSYYSSKQEYNQSFIGVINKIFSQLPSLIENFNTDILPKLQKQIEELQKSN